MFWVRFIFSFYFDLCLNCVFVVVAVVVYMIIVYFYYNCIYSFPYWPFPLSFYFSPLAPSAVLVLPPPQRGHKVKNGHNDKLMKNCFWPSVPLGSIQELPAETCDEIKRSEGHAVSGKYWFSTIKSGTSVLAYCNMKTNGEFSQFHNRRLILEPSNRCNFPLCLLFVMTTEKIKLQNLTVFYYAASLTKVNLEM